MSNISDRTPPSDDLQKRMAAELEGRLVLTAVSRRKSGFSDLRESVLQARSYRIWQSLLSRVRQIKLIALLLRVVAWLFMLLQTGTLLLLTTAVFFVLLPLAAVALLLLLAVALPDRVRCRKQLQKLLQGKSVYVFFGRLAGVGEQTARELAADPAHAVLVVSPYWLLPAGLGNRRFYLNRRQLSPRLFLIRRSFYFSLRRYLQENRTMLIF